MKKKDFIIIGNQILDKIGENVLDYVNFNRGLPQENIVSNRTGRLVDSILGGRGNKDHIRSVEFENDSMVLTIGTKVPYAALLEKGGIRVVTDKMRRFFWAKYFETKDSDSPISVMWSILRFKDTIIYRPRPYFKPAVESVIPEIKQIFRENLMNILRTTIKETITGAMKAQPLGTE